MCRQKMAQMRFIKKLLYIYKIHSINFQERFDLNFVV